jgi:hypothetical protein
MIPSGLNILVAFLGIISLVESTQTVDNTISHVEKMRLQPATNENIEVQIISPAHGSEAIQRRRRTDEATVDTFFFIPKTLFQDEKHEKKKAKPTISHDDLKRVKKSVDYVQHILETKNRSADKKLALDDIATTRKKDKIKTSKKFDDDDDDYDDDIFQLLLSSTPSDVPSDTPSYVGGPQRPSPSLKKGKKDKKNKGDESSSPSPSTFSLQPTLECKSEKKKMKKKKKKKSDDFNTSDSPSLSPSFIPSAAITITIATPTVCKMAKGMMGMMETMKGMTKGKSFKAGYPTISPTTSIAPSKIDKGLKMTKEPKSTKAPTNIFIDPPVSGSTRQPSSTTTIIPTITASPTTETFSPTGTPCNNRFIV